MVTKKSIDQQPEVVEVSPDIQLSVGAEAELSNGVLAQTTDQDIILNSMDIAEGVLERGSLSTGLFTFSNGVVIRCERPPAYLMQRAVDQFKAPEVPEYYDEDFQADRPNPSDPDYVAAVEIYQREVVNLVTNLYLGYFSMVSTPNIIDKPDDLNWSEDMLESFGMPMPVAGRARRLAWLKYYVCHDENEEKELISFVFMYNGRLKEEDVRKKLDSFRSVQEPDVDPVL